MFQRLQPLNPLLSRGVGAEELAHGDVFAGEGVDDEHVGGLGFGLGDDSASGVVVEFAQSRLEPFGVAGHASRALIGHEFSAAADGHLDDSGGHGGEEHEGEHHDKVRPVAIPSTTEKHPEIGQHTDRSCDGGGDGANEHVVVFDVAELVGDDRFDLLFAQEVEQTFGDGDGGVMVVPSGGEGIGLVIGEDIECRHRQTSPGGQAVDDPVQTGGGAAVDGVGVVVLEYLLVAVVIGIKVHPRCHHKRDNHPGLACECSPDEDEEERECGEEKIGFESFHV